MAPHNDDHEMEDATAGASNDSTNGDFVHEKQRLRLVLHHLVFKVYTKHLT